MAFFAQTPKIVFRHYQGMADIVGPAPLFDSVAVGPLFALSTFPGASVLRPQGPVGANYPLRKIGLLGRPIFHNAASTR